MVLCRRVHTSAVCVVMRALWCSTGSRGSHQSCCCLCRTVPKSDILGRYTMSNDPCRPQRVVRDIHMHESIQGLLERSTKGQSDEVGHALDFSEDSGIQEAAASHKGGGGVLSWGVSLGGWRRRLFGHGKLDAAADEMGTSGSMHGRGLAAEEDAGTWDADADAEADAGLEAGNKELDPGIAEALNWQNLTLFSRDIAAFDVLGEAGSLRTRPMLLHKVANPLHMYYMHWRLRHCRVPKRDLIFGPGEELALRDLPSLHDIFHVSPRKKAGE